MVDAGYANRTGFLAPYKGERYHIPQFQREGRAAGRKEIFNHAHSSLRSVIERTFGVTKKKWPILGSMPSFSFRTQVKIVFACMALHNFIRLNAQFDLEFARAEDDEIGVSQEGGSQDNEEGRTVDMRDDRHMSHVRDIIADQLFSIRTTN